MVCFLKTHFNLLKWTKSNFWTFSTKLKFCMQGIERLLFPKYVWCRSFILYSRIIVIRSIEFQYKKNLGFTLHYINCSQTIIINLFFDIFGLICLFHIVCYTEILLGNQRLILSIHFYEHVLLLTSNTHQYLTKSVLAVDRNDTSHVSLSLCVVIKYG